MKTDNKTLPAQLREYNAWRRGNETLDQPSAAWVGAVIDAAADRLEELEEQLSANHEAIKLMGKWLEDEQELADRLAGVLLSYHHDLLAGEDMQWLPEHDKSLAVWKEARHDT
jgi:hypothetical protein